MMKSYGISYRYAAENIAKGYQTPAAVVNGWMNSEGHRKNMLGDFQMLGVGAAYNAGSAYGFYFTQDFYAGG